MDRRLAWTVTLGIAIALCAAPVAAHAATVGVEGGVLRVVGDPGDNDDIAVVPRDDGTIFVGNGGSKPDGTPPEMTAGSGCTPSTDGFANVTCPSAGVTSLSLTLGDGKDRYEAHEQMRLPSTIDGGDGDDVLIGGEGPDRIVGGPGADALMGKGGDDTLEAADGQPDKGVDCGAGTDTGNGDPTDPRGGCENGTLKSAPPKVRFTFSISTSASETAKKGLLIGLSVPSGIKVKYELRLSPAVAKRLGLSSTQIGKQFVNVPQGRLLNRRVKISAQAQQAFRRTKPRDKYFSVIVNVTYTTDGGATSTGSRKVQILPGF